MEGMSLSNLRIYFIAELRLRVCFLEPQPCYFAHRNKLTATDRINGLNSFSAGDSNGLHPLSTHCSAPTRELQLACQLVWVV